MKTIKKYFTIIELVTASTLMLILFMIIGFVFGSVSDITSKLNDKISEGLRANYFFSQLADDLESSFPVFYLGDGSDGQHVNIAFPGGTDPKLSLPGGYVTGGINGVKLTYGNAAKEFIRCVSTNHIDGGLLGYNGFESLNVNINVDQNDKPVRYVTYNLVGTVEPAFGGFHARSLYRRDFPLRPDTRKMKAIRGGYSVGAGGNYVDVGMRGDGDTVAGKPADGDINETLMLEGVWEVRVEFLETAQNDGIAGFGEKVLVKVTVEYAFTDSSFPYGHPSRFTQHPVGDMDGNSISDRLEHTYTTVIVVNRSNWNK